MNMAIPTSPILADLYELTMMYAWFQSGRINRQACYDLFFRKSPYQGEYIVAAGIDDALSFLIHACFSPEDIRYIRSLRLFSDPFLKWLSNWRFDGTVHAVQEGTIVFPGEPVLRVTGPVGSCQLVETALLNLINFPSLIATKAARICSIAGWENVLEFGARRAQGPDGALTASRAAYIGGCAATSNLEAGKIFGIPVSGTHSHSFVMSFGSELEAFREYARTYPGSTVLLLDTYDTLNSGVVHAITVGKEMEERGDRLGGIRLDSGDLRYLSAEVRKKLDEAGLDYVHIIASGDLDEHIISRLISDGACIDRYGVGTHLVTGHDTPALAGVYKLSAMADPAGEWDMRMKITDGPEKTSLPGIKQVWREFDAEGLMRADIIELASVHPGIPGIVPLLAPVLADGCLSSSPRPVSAIRDAVRRSLVQVPPAVTRLSSPARYEVHIGQKLKDVQMKLKNEYRKEQTILH